MIKNVIFSWEIENVNKKKLLILLKKSKDFILKHKIKLIIFPPSLYLDFINSKYKGRSIFFGLSDESLVADISILKDLKIKYIINRNKNNKLIKKYLDNNINVIFNIGEKSKQNDEKFILELENQLINIFKEKKKKNMKNIFLVYSSTLSHNDNLKNDFQKLERVFMFFKKKVYDIFGEESKEVNFFYKIEEDAFDFYKKLSFIDGLYIK